MGKDGEKCLPEKGEWYGNQCAERQRRQRDFNDERTCVRSPCRKIRRKWKEREGKRGGKEASDLGKSRSHVVSSRIKVGQTLPQDCRFDKAREPADDAAYGENEKECRKALDDSLFPIGFGGNGQLFPEAEYRRNDVERRCRRRTDEIAGEGAEGHYGEHRQEPDRRANHADECVATEFLQGLKGVGENGAYDADERRNDDECAKGILDNAYPFKKERQNDPRDDDRNKEKDCRCDEYAAHERLEFAEFTVHGQTGQFIPERVGKNGGGQGEEVREVR